MKAVRFHAAKDIRVDEIEVPSIKPGWVKIKTAFCGICGSDLHEYEDGPHIIPPASGAPHSQTGETAPLTIGHEFSGTITEVADDVKDFKVGDKVCVQPIIWDGDCRSCARGLKNSCDQWGFIGLSGWGGGMGEYTCAPASYCKKLPDDMDLDIGALIEPLAVAWHAVSTSPFKKGDDVLVLGGGPIGLAVVLTLVAKGCTNVTVAEVSKRRREFAENFGAHHVIDPTKVDPVESIKSFTNGQGADLIFDAAGVQVAVDYGLKALKARGTFVNIALWGAQRVQLDMTVMLFGERKYIATVTYIDGDFEAVIDAVAKGDLKPHGMITKVIRPDQVAEEGFKSLVEDKENQVKILVDMSKVSDIESTANGS